MKQEDRELLARIDERTRNIWRAVEKIEKHQSVQNGYIQQLFKCTNSNTVWRKVIVGVGSSVLLLIIAWITHLNGFWIL
jgi:hypothetical protein